MPDIPRDLDLVERVNRLERTLKAHLGAHGAKAEEEPSGPIKPDPAPCDDDEGTEQAECMHTFWDGACTDCGADEPEPAPMPCEGKVCNCHEVDPDPAPSIPESWDLITAGDGRTYEHTPTNAPYEWRPMGAVLARWITTAEILEMGTVRRAVVITVPDDVPIGYATVEMERLFPGTRFTITVDDGVLADGAVDLAGIVWRITHV